MEHSEKDMRTLADLFGQEPSPPEPKKAGRPPFKPAETFDGAMAALKPKEAQFVRHVLAGDNHATAYGKTHPVAQPITCRVNGNLVAKRQRVAHALALGRNAGALQAIAGIKYDVATAHDELCQRIEAAHKEGQHNAVASLMKLKLALHKLDQSAPQAVQGVQIILQTADGEVVRSFGTPPQRAEVVVQPVAGESENDDQGS
jgi:hypothetical protein